MGTDAQEIYTVDEDTFAVSRFPVPNLGSSVLLYPNVIAMANGKVLLIGQIQGIETLRFLTEVNTSSNGTPHRTLSRN